MEGDYVTKKDLQEAFASFAKNELQQMFVDFAEQLKVWFDARLDEKLEKKFDEKLTPIWNELHATRLDVADLRNEMRDGFSEVNGRIDRVYNHVDHFTSIHRNVTERLSRLELKQAT
jgi:hypothetical protein